MAEPYFFSFFSLRIQNEEQVVIDSRIELLREEVLMLSGGVRHMVVVRCGIEGHHAGEK